MNATTDDAGGLPDVDLSRRTVRIRARHDNGFIEFDFSIGWPDLVVELVMAPAEFDAFCREQRVKVLPAFDAPTPPRRSPSEE